MLNYFLAHLRSNKVKSLLLLLSIVVYFSAAVLAKSLNDALPKIAALPLQTIGANTIVQTSGVIPDELKGIVFPHSNGPIYEKDYRRLAKLEFVKAADRALYFWDFTNDYKSVIGFEKNGPILGPIISGDLSRGRRLRDPRDVLVSQDYFQKNRLRLGQTLYIRGRPFRLVGILKSAGEAQVMPSDMYIDLRTAQDEFGAAEEVQRNYRLKTKQFVNVVLLRSEAGFQKNINRLIGGVNSEFLIYSEETFSKQIQERVLLLSMTGQAIMAVLGLLLVLAFTGLVFYMVKSREKEVAILRALGWKVSLIRAVFTRELAVIIFAGLLLGNAAGLAAIKVISMQKVSIEIPWEVSAKPHFLEEANSINRIVRANIPLVGDLSFSFALSVLFALIFLTVAWLTLGRVKRVKALDVMLR